MRGLLLVVVILGAAYGGFMALNAISAGTSAVHEIEGLIGVLIVVVAASAGYIASAIDESRKPLPLPPGYIPPPPP